AQQHLQRAVGLVLGGARQRGGAEQRDGALVTRASERPSLDHRASRGGVMACMILALAALVALGAVAQAGDTQLSGVEGHPRARLPLSVWMQASGDAALDAAARRALDDWNVVARDALGVEAFSLGARESAQVRVALEPP